MVNLKPIIDNHALSDVSPMTFRSELKKAYPNEDVQAINILTMLYDWGIQNKLTNITSINDMQIEQYLEEFESEYGISPNYAHKQFLVWMGALDITKTQKSIIENNNDYEIVEKPDGFYISRFIGFEEEKIIGGGLMFGRNENEASRVLSFIFSNLI